MREIYYLTELTWLGDANPKVKDVTIYRGGSIGLSISRSNNDPASDVSNSKFSKRKIFAGLISPWKKFFSWY